MDLILALGASIAGGAITGIITVISLKTDVKWIIINHNELKKGHGDLIKRVNVLERV